MLCGYCTVAGAMVLSRLPSDVRKIFTSDPKISPAAHATRVPSLENENKLPYSANKLLPSETRHIRAPLSIAPATNCPLVEHLTPKPPPLSVRNSAPVVGLYSAMPRYAL